MLNHLASFFNIKNVARLFFGVYLILGLTIFNDYGMSWDEPIERLTGLVSVKYLSNLFHLNPVLCSNHCDFENAPLLHEYKDRFYGSWFQITARLGESMLGVKTFYNAMRLRHIMTFLLFYIGSIYLFKTIDYLFKNKYLALLCTALFISQPRFFAEQFYNTKDIVFLSVTCFSLYFTIKFLREQTMSSCLKAAFFTGLIIATRIIGIIILVEVLFILVVDLFLIKSIHTKKHLLTISLYGAVSLLFTVLLWPYLWSNPFNNFHEAFMTMKKFQWDKTILINGEQFNATNLPWYYLPNWIAISTPLLIILLILVSISLFLFKCINNFRVKNYSNLRIELIYFGILVLPLIAVKIMNSVVYDGWRHVYFTFTGGFICIAWLFSQLTHHINYRKLTSILYGFAIIQLAWNIYQNIKMHPYQNVYFNQLAKVDLRKNYEMDYWGLSYKEGLYHILKTDSRKKINIHLIGSRDNLRFLEFPNDRRFNFVELKEADYFLTNYRWHPQEYTEYHEIYSINSNNAKIMSVFKLK